MNIVSLLPSATEVICELGLGDRLVGVTHECDYPAFVKNLPKVTKTLIPHDAASAEIDALVRERMKTQRALYTLDLPTLERLAPDLIVTQALCDVCAVAEAEVTAAACRLPGRPRVVNLEPTTYLEMIECIQTVADAASVRASKTILSLSLRVDALLKRTQKMLERPGAVMPRVVLLEWLDPPFSSGHWTPELVTMAGGDEVLGKAGERSRTLTWDEVAAAKPDVIFIACCGFNVERTLVDLPLLKVKADRVFVTDGNAYFSRPGPRLVDSLEILAHALHPTIHPLPPGLPAAIQVHPE